jgi:hypothetical protein
VTYVNWLHSGLPPAFLSGYDVHCSPLSQVPAPQLVPAPWQPSVQAVPAAAVQAGQGCQAGQVQQELQRGRADGGKSLSGRLVLLLQAVETRVALMRWMTNPAPCCSLLPPVDHMPLPVSHTLHTGQDLPQCWQAVQV